MPKQQNHAWIINVSKNEEPSEEKSETTLIIRAQFVVEQKKNLMFSDHKMKIRKYRISTDQKL